jgi:hypothetical protein
MTTITDTSITDHLTIGKAYYLDDCGHIGILLKISEKNLLFKELKAGNYIQSDYSDIYPELIFPVTGFPLKQSVVNYFKEVPLDILKKMVVQVPAIDIKIGEVVSYDPWCLDIGVCVYNKPEQVLFAPLSNTGYYDQILGPACAKDINIMVVPFISSYMYRFS